MLASGKISKLKYAPIQNSSHKKIEDFNHTYQQQFSTFSFISNITNENFHKYSNRIRIPIIDPDATREFQIVLPKKSAPLAFQNYYRYKLVK